MSDSQERGISKRGLEKLKTIVMKGEHKLNDEQRKKMRREITEEPNIYDPSAEFREYPVGTTIYIPAWLNAYISTRKMFTKKGKAQQIREIVENYIASEILELLGEDLNE
jgi:hypothetical protein